MRRSRITAVATTAVVACAALLLQPAGAVPSAPGADTAVTRPALPNRPAADFEGSLAQVQSTKQRGWSLAAPAATTRKAKRALRAGPLVGGRHPRVRQPNEPYLPQLSCYAGELPGVVDFREMLLRTYPRSAESLGIYNISRGCNVPGISEHEEGRALDWEARVDDRTQDAQARQLLRWLTKRGGYHAKRFGIDYIIYDQHVWGQYNQRWRAMGDRGSVTANHKDHVHFTFTWNGALKRSAWWTGRARPVHRGPCARFRGHFAPLDPVALARSSRTGRCPAPRPIPASWRYGPSVMYWEQNSRVTWLHQFLAENGLYDGDPVSAFNRTTYAAVQAYQRRNGVPATGVWDAATQHVSGRVVDQRLATPVSWNAATVTAVAGQVIELPVTVGGPAGERAIRLDQQIDGAWVEVQRGTLTVPGTWVPTITAESGSATYRVMVERTSAAKVGETRPKRITVPVPQPSTTASPSGNPASPSPTLPTP